MSPWYEGERTHEQSSGVGARNEVGGRKQRAIGDRRNHETRVRANSVRVRLDRPQIGIRRYFSFDQLNQLERRLRTKFAEIGLERLDEHRRSRFAPSVAIERREYSILEWQADAAEVGGMFALGIDADRATELVAELQRQLDHFVEGWHLELPVPAMRAETDERRVTTACLQAGATRNSARRRMRDQCATERLLQVAFERPVPLAREIHHQDARLLMTAANRHKDFNTTALTCR